MPSDAAAAAPLPLEEPDELPADDNGATTFLVGQEPGAGPDTSGSGECCGTGEGGDDPRGGGSGTGEASPLRVGGEVRPPAKLRHVAPRYPPLALQARISGTVELDCLIDETGRVTGVRVLSGHPFLAPAAVEAVQQWLYSPTRLNGLPVAVLLTVSVRFEIRR
jgi:protein TonB